MDTLQKLKDDFFDWCGFSLEGENYEEVMANIKSRTYQLECEISDQGDKLRDRAAKFFKHED